MKTEIFELNDATQNKILRDIGKALTSTLDQEKVLNMIMEFIGNYYRPENWSLLLVDEEKFDLYFAIAVGKTSDLIKDKRLKIGQGIAGWSLTHKETVLIRDAYQDERFNPAFDKESGFRTSSIICVPMVNQGKALGIIELINIQEHFFEKPYVQLLETLADFAAIAIENSRYISRIKEVSIKDDCTNLYNSRHMIELLEIEMKRAKRGKNTFAVVFLDLDHFKRVNDNYGHIVGSQLLREIANILLKNIRSSDWAIRYGGDEFVLILPGMNQENAFKLTKRIREELNSTVFFQKEGYNIHITASFGIAVFPKDASTIDEIIKMADHAMYDVKKRGRDNIQLAIK
ncbi:MAG: sensor domain-containing diguanylate cyclase [Candidatus Cloacimonadota bacterium]|nr:MAG: sensor domain-containing diguanylate cyclase [Candidatus Cloacimonadota bacterium]